MLNVARNGALTIGTLDGANIEIRDHVGEENIFIFGMKADEVVKRRSLGLDATDTIEQSSVLARVIEALERGDFSPDDPSRFTPITHALKYLDFYMVAADFEDYHRAQRLVDKQWATPGWASSAMLNVARMGWFSSDRTIREYAEDIWGLAGADFRSADGRLIRFHRECSAARAADRFSAGACRCRTAGRAHFHSVVDDAKAGFIIGLARTPLRPTIHNRFCGGPHDDALGKRAIDPRWARHSDRRPDARILDTSRPFDRVRG
jgi:hypothetical protein